MSMEEDVDARKKRRRRGLIYVAAYIYINCW